MAPNQEGRLSNPVQRRLSKHEVDELVSAYLAGSSIDSLAAKVGVNRTTIAAAKHGCCRFFAFAITIATAASPSRYELLLTPPT